MNVSSRIKESLQRDGLWATCKWCARTLWNRRLYLVYEPAITLRGVPPRADFDTAHTRIAVQIHMYYPHLAEEMIEYTNRLPYRFDCYLSTDTQQKAEEVYRAFQRGSRASRIEVGVYPNRGRDVAPFLFQLEPVIDRYDYLLHLHTKYSPHNDFGNQWRRYLLNSLLASKEYVAALFLEMEKEKRVGIVFQRTYWRVKPSLGWKGNKEPASAFLARMGLADSMCREPRFPAGDMFWAKMAAVRPVFRCGLTVDDFAKEAKQVDGTLAHCVERCWSCIAASQGYGFLRVRPPLK